MASLIFLLSLVTVCSVIHRLLLCLFFKQWVAHSYGFPSQILDDQSNTGSKQNSTYKLCQRCHLVMPGCHCVLVYNYSVQFPTISLDSFFRSKESSTLPFNSYRNGLWKVNNSHRDKAHLLQSRNLNTPTPSSPRKVPRLRTRTFFRFFPTFQQPC